jgi:hypothetical protein
MGGPSSKPGGEVLARPGPAARKVVVILIIYLTWLLLRIWR